jgi:PAS domain S-box-containing protein
MTPDAIHTSSSLPGTVVHGRVVFNETIADCNEPFCRMMGATRGEIVGRRPLEISPELQADGAFSRERWQRRWHAACAGLPQWFAWQFRNAQGRRVHALVHLASDAAAGGMLLCDVHDLSPLGGAGWAQPDSRSRLQQVLDHTKAIMLLKDREGRYLVANRELERVARTPAEQIVGRTDSEIWPPDIAELFRTNDERVLSERRAVEFEVTADVGRERRTFQAFKFPLFGLDGEPYALCGVATDITDRKRTQDALTSAALAVSSSPATSVFQELVRYLATILEVDAALIAVSGEENPCNMRVRAFFLDGEIRENFDYPIGGTPCETVVGQAFRIYASGLREQFPQDLEFHKLGFESYAGFPLSAGTGAPLGLIAVISRRPMENAELIESILKIFAVRAAAELERQHSEEVLRRSEASYRAIFEASEDAIFIHDWDSGAIIDVNLRACQLYGYTYEELKSIKVAAVSTGIHPYTAEEAAKWLQKAKAGQSVRFEWHRRNKDGSLHWDDVVLRPAIIEGQRRIVGFTREVTERKQAEQALRQAQKMEALGHLTGGIAHDFNNLLTSILGYIVLAADQPVAAADAKLTKYLEQAQLSSGRARDLIQQMLTFSRGQRGRPRPVSLPPLINQSVKLFASSFPSTVEIRTDLEREVPAVMLDPVHLDQVLLNLCLNARDAMSGVGVIQVSVASTHGGGRQCTGCRQATHGEFVELCVEDDGPGIAPEVVDRMFEPFFTTKDVGKGSGMGLSSVHGIVHELGGHIVVETAPGRGSLFRVLLPALAADVDKAGADETSRSRMSLARLEGHVLVVDDEQAVGAFMRDLLESWGLEVTVASAAPDALSLVARNAANYEIVITDQLMPRMTGIQLARELQAIRPDLPVILYTGFNEGISRSEIETAGLRAVVTKPVDPHELYGLLQTWLPHTSPVTHT